MSTGDQNGGTNIVLYVHITIIISCILWYLIYFLSSFSNAYYLYVITVCTRFGMLTVLWAIMLLTWSNVIFEFYCGGYDCQTKEVKNKRKYICILISFIYFVIITLIPLLWTIDENIVSLNIVNLILLIISFIIAILYILAGISLACTIETATTKSGQELDFTMKKVILTLRIASTSICLLYILQTICLLFNVLNLINTRNDLLIWNGIWITCDVLILFCIILCYKSRIDRNYCSEYKIQSFNIKKHIYYCPYFIDFLDFTVKILNIKKNNICACCAGKHKRLNIINTSKSNEMAKSTSTTTTTKDDISLGYQINRQNPVDNFSKTESGFTIATTDLTATGTQVTKTPTVSNGSNNINKVPVIASSYVNSRSTSTTSATNQGSATKE